MWGGMAEEELFPRTSALIQTCGIILAAEKNDQGV